MQYKAEITRAVEYAADLRTAILNQECGNLHKPISILLHQFDNILNGRKGISVTLFCSMAQNFLRNIEKYKSKKGGEGVLPGISFRRPVRRA